MNQRRSFLAHTDPKKINFLTVKNSIERKINDINSYQKNNRGAIFTRLQKNRKPSQRLNNSVGVNSSVVEKVKPKGVLELLAQEKNNARFNNKQKQNANYNKIPQEKENLGKSIEQQIEDVKNKILELQEKNKTNRNNKKVDGAIKGYETTMGLDTDSLPNFINDKEKYFFGTGKTTSFYYPPQKQHENSNKIVTEESIEDSGTKISIVVNNNRCIK